MLTTCSTTLTLLLSKNPWLMLPTPASPNTPVVGDPDDPVS